MLPTMYESGTLRENCHISIFRPPQYHHHNSNNVDRHSPPQFVWPPPHSAAGVAASSNNGGILQQTPNYVTTSTPVTQSSPSRHFQHLGLPVASTQYKSPYAVPQSSSGSSAISSREAGPMPLPMKLKPSYQHQYSARQSPAALPVSTFFQVAIRSPSASPKDDLFLKKEKLIQAWQSTLIKIALFVVLNGCPLERKRLPPCILFSLHQMDIFHFHGSGTRILNGFSLFSASSSYFFLLFFQPTVLIQPQRNSPHHDTGYAKYLHHQSRVMRSNGFTVPSGDEMSTELWWEEERVCTSTNYSMFHLLFSSQNTNGTLCTTISNFDDQTISIKTKYMIPKCLYLLFKVKLDCKLW